MWVCAAFITLFTPFEYLSDMTSISSLFSFFVVALGLLWRRHYGVGGHAKGVNPWLPALILSWLVISGVGLPSSHALPCVNGSATPAEKPTKPGWCMRVSHEDWLLHSTDNCLLGVIQLKVNGGGSDSLRVWTVVSVNTS